METGVSLRRPISESTQTASWSALVAAKCFIDTRPCVSNHQIVTTEKGDSYTPLASLPCAVFEGLYADLSFSLSQQPDEVGPVIVQLRSPPSPEEGSCWVEELGLDPRPLARAPGPTVGVWAVLPWKSVGPRCFPSPIFSSPCGPQECL